MIIKYKSTPSFNSIPSEGLSSANFLFNFRHEIPHFATKQNKTYLEGRLPEMQFKIHAIKPSYGPKTP